MPKNGETFPPLREPTYYILLSLRARSKHGYAIIRDVEEMSRSQIILSAGTLYEALARLLDQGWIDRIEENPEVENPIRPGKPRKTYRLTKQGLRVLEAEITRLEQLLAAARHSLNAGEADA